MPEIDIRGAIIRLKNNAGGEAYDLFLKALETEAVHVTVTVISSSRDQLEVKQGQAQMMQKFLQWFKEAK